MDEISPAFLVLRSPEVLFECKPLDFLLLTDKVGDYHDEEDYLDDIFVIFLRIIDSECQDSRKYHQQHFEGPSVENKQHDCHEKLLIEGDPERNSVIFWFHVRENCVIVYDDKNCEDENNEVALVFQLWEFF